jgi:large subunit ribosomal protein L4
MKLSKVTATGTKSTLTVSDEVFAVEVNQPLLAQAIRVYLSNGRQGTSRVKTRGEIVRTKKKWYKQKGTGNARHGARSAHIFVGGGVAHGPKGNENWSKNLNKKMKLKALATALTLQAKQIVVSDEVAKLDGKTKSGVELLKKSGVDAQAKVLVVVSDLNENLDRSLRNLEQVLLRRAYKVNALDIAMADQIVITSDAVKEIEARIKGDK